MVHKEPRNHSKPIQAKPQIQCRSLSDHTICCILNHNGFMKKTQEGSIIGKKNTKQSHWNSSKCTTSIAFFTIIVEGYQQIYLHLHMCSTRVENAAQIVLICLIDTLYRLKHKSAFFFHYQYSLLGGVFHYYESTLEVCLCIPTQDTFCFCIISLPFHSRNRDSKQGQALNSKRHTAHDKLIRITWLSSYSKNPPKKHFGLNLFTYI